MLARQWTRTDGAALHVEQLLIDSEYTLHHNRFRPHQGLGNRPLDADEDPPPETAEIEAGSVRR